MEQIFEIRIQNVPGILARVEAIFRRQRAPILGMFLEGEEGSTARLSITAEANLDAANLLRKQLMRLMDVHAVTDSGVSAAHAFAPPESLFTFEEKSA
jgi:acetolactate synthase small subunit